MIQSNNIIILIIFSFQLNVLQAQNTFVKWYNSDIDDGISDIEHLEPSNHYMFILSQSTPIDYYNLDPLFLFYNSTFKIYLTDQEFNYIDSLSIEKVDGYNCLLFNFLDPGNDTIIIQGVAYDSVANDMQIALVWIDENLNIVKDSLYGGSYDFEFAGKGFINYFGNVVIHPMLNPEWLKPPANGEVGASFWEISQSGEMIYNVKDSLLPTYRSLVALGSSGKYHRLSNDSTQQLNPDFSINTTFPFNPQNTRIWYSKYYKENQYLILGDTFRGLNPINPIIGDFDLSIIHVDNMANILNYNTYGILDTTDRIGDLDFCSPDTLFLGGTKHVMNEPVDNWIELYKTDLNGTIYYERFYGGYGKYSLHKVLATQDGGCILLGAWWDFYNFPEPYQQYDGFIMKVDANGLITGIGEQAVPFESTDIIVYPNPGTDHLKIASAKKSLRFQLFDLSGNLIIKKDFYNTLDLNTSLIKNGTYMYCIIQQGKEIKSGKWIKK